VSESDNRNFQESESDDGTSDSTALVNTDLTITKTNNMPLALRCCTVNKQIKSWQQSADYDPRALSMYIVKV